MNLNIVPASFIKKSLTDTVFDKHNEQTKEKIGEIRCQSPIEVLFEGADTEIYKPTKEFSKELVDELKDIKEDFCFLFVGHWLEGGLGHDRKDLGMLIKVNNYYRPLKPRNLSLLHLKILLLLFRFQIV